MHYEKHLIVFNHSYQIEVRQEIEVQVTSMEYRIINLKLNLIQ